MAVGEAAYMRDEKDVAKKRFKQAFAIDGTLASARADLGRLLYEEDKNAEALKELKRATEDAPKLGKAWFYLAFAQNKAGQASTSSRSLSKRRWRQPDLAEAHVQLERLTGAEQRARKRARATGGLACGRATKRRSSRQSGSACPRAP